MGLENRHGRLYFTRSKRIKGKVKREYVASGLLAQIAAFDDALTRLAAQEVKRWQQEHWQQEREAADALDGAVCAVCEEATAAFCTAMTEAGYHQHNRGEWRKKRREEPDGV